MKLIKKYWDQLSYLGIEKSEQNLTDEVKIRVFFNRCIFVGFFSLLATLATTFPFIKSYALLNLINCVVIILAFYFQAQSKFYIAKRLIVYSLFAVGLVLTTVSGPDFLYHTGIITVVIFAWITFSFEKEYLELILFFILGCTGFILAEMNIFNVNFESHPNLEQCRIISLIGFTGTALIFITFIRRLNLQYEEKLMTSISEKEVLITDVLAKTEELQQKRTILEDEISKRTHELSVQKRELEIENKTKEVLLKEIHHRVKNNLQIIISLLNLQFRKFEDPKIINAINETQNRIISMSLVHQRMYQTADFVLVEFKEYIDLLLDNNRILFSKNEDEIEYVNNISRDFKVDIEKAIPIGLMINEMITNSHKHAFKPGTISNRITLALEEENGTYHLIYSDNGIGFPSNINLKNLDSLGIELIHSLAEQINGAIKLYNDEGAFYKISFELTN